MRLREYYDQTVLSCRFRESDPTREADAQRIWTEHLQKVGTPQSLLFASRLALQEARMATVFDNLRNLDDSQPSQNRDIAAITADMSSIYQEMAKHYHSPADELSVLIYDYTTTHLNLLRQFGFTTAGCEQYARIMVHLAQDKIVESGYEELLEVARDHSAVL